MITPPERRPHEANTQPDQEDSKLERLVKHIEPPGRDVTDDDLKDPGRMTPNSTPTDNRS
ncbi:MAG TPA: hypothetical protein VEB70_04785 [Noviherbaspirillum sp.]|nr:hypothetical protein [Noviherbaspirillum sp.]